MYFVITKLKPNAEYNRRVEIIEDLHAGHSATEIIRFFEYPWSIVYNIVIKYTILEQFNEHSSMSARDLLERTHREDPRSRWKLISDDPKQSLQKLASIVGVSEPTMLELSRKTFNTNRTH